MEPSRSPLESERPLIMGILNVTPDSFSDGGCFTELDFAVTHALRMAEEGADIIDVGGESTRPGSDPVSAEEQTRRVLPAVRALRRTLPPSCLISIDTERSEVAQAALEAGADMINDVSAGRGDPRMFALAAEHRVPIVLMHMQGTPKTMQDNPVYRDAVEEVRSFLLERAERAQAAGVDPKRIIIDPGIGFGKRTSDNLALLRRLARFVDTGFPVLLGTSRKRFMGAICRVESPTELVAATIATTVLGVMSGVRVFRVHDVRENRQAVDVTRAVRCG